MAMKRPRPLSSAASTAAWPPAPKVASTTVSPGWISRRSRTSSASTGTWSVPLSCKTFGNMLRAPFELVALLSPGVAIPDLEPVADTGHDDLPPEVRVLGEPRRDHDPTLLVEVRLRGGGEEVALQLARLAAERVERPESVLHVLLPVGAPEDLEARVEPARDDDAVAEGFAEAGREREAALVIDGVLVLAEEHWRGLLSRRAIPTLNHHSPLRNTCTPSRPRGLPG